MSCGRKGWLGTREGWFGAWILLLAGWLASESESERACCGHDLLCAEELGWACWAKGVHKIAALCVFSVARLYYWSWNTS